MKVEKDRSIARDPARKRAARTKQRAEFIALASRLNGEQQRLLLSVAEGLFRPLRPVFTERDAELVWLCERWVVVLTAIEAVYAGTPHINDRKREAMLDPFYDRKHEIMDQIFKLDLPTTPEGARAAARAVLADHPGDRDEAVQNCDMRMWLSLGCARYLAAEASA